MNVVPAAALPPATAARQTRAPASAWFALAVLVMATVIGAVDKVIFTLLAEPIKHTLSLSDTQLGAIQGLGVALFTGLATLPLGWMSDRYDRRRVLAACIVFWSVMTTLRGFAPDYRWMLVASIGLGIGEAGLGPVINSLLPDLFGREQRVVANAVFMLAALFGAALGAVISGAAITASEAVRHLLPAALAGAETWRLTFHLLAAAGAPVALLVLCMRAVPRGGTAGVGTTGPAPAFPPAAPAFISYLRRHWRTLTGLLVGTGLGGIGLNGIGSWVPVHAARHFGLAPADIGQYLGAAFVGGTLMGTVVGVVALRLALRRMGPAATMRLITLGYLCAGLMSVTLLFASSAAELFGAMALVITPLIASVIVLPNAMQDAGPALLRGRVMAVLTIGQLLFSSLGPLGIGVLSDAVQGASSGSLVTALVAVTLVTGTLGALVLWRTEASFVRLAQSNRA